jgi:hypothetical protein
MTLTIDEGLVAQAKAMTGNVETSAVVIQREVARRLIELGGTDPDFVAPQRRRSKFSWRERIRMLMEG